ncbi:MAG: hypothetical protein COX43_03555 [Parcubacteria group bacterium CG23_combo_of_CG06-09_8_20_14_all_35_9]|nr:MAG: hypothetical protein COX43_03555 [Parcubacteria group bacterium CG23_combo_of_CG06-09_8_20_14_all_35_9]
MTIQDLLNTIKTNNPEADLDLVKLAYEFAQKAHKGQKRLSGEDYIQHPLHTAQILAEMRADITSIIAGLLHDVPEDTNYTIQDIEKDFGKEVASLVDGITKLGKIKYRGIERYVENLRKMFIAMATDIRTILIKLADRLHNLKTLSALPPKKQYRIALETLEIYTPCAGRLGMRHIKRELEDAAFPYVYPKEYKWVKSIASIKYKEKEKYLEKVKKILEQELRKASIKFFSVQGRAKGLYSLYRKLLSYDRDISKIYDLIALRIIVENISECYATLGIIHSKWNPFKNRFKDYIAQPKPNGYQSLHTTVFCEGREIVEFQIRTRKMHEEAEYGIAAHWHYNEKGSVVFDSKHFKWVQELAKWQEEAKDYKKYLEDLESLKIDVFRNRIFVFTPQGDVIDLPEDSTPIDFAYYIHTDIGNKCSGARVNDQIASLDTKLKSGDVVEIITDKNRKSPNPDWLKFVKTRSAASRIRSQIRVSAQS